MKNPLPCVLGAGVASLALLALTLSGPPPAPLLAEERPFPLTEKVHHIGNSEKPEWKDFTTVMPEHASRLKIVFRLERDPDPSTLQVRAGGVGEVWKVKVNHKEIGVLKKGEAAQSYYFEVPSSLLTRTENELLIETDVAEDDI